MLYLFNEKTPIKQQLLHYGSRFGVHLGHFCIIPKGKAFDFARRDCALNKL